MLTLAAFTLALNFFHLAVSAPVVELQPQFKLTCPSKPGWKDRGDYGPGFLPNDQLSWCKLKNLSCSAGGEFVEPTPPLPDNTCSDCQCERLKAQPPPSSAYSLVCPRVNLPPSPQHQKQSLQQWCEGTVVGLGCDNDGKPLFYGLDFFAPRCAECKCEPLEGTAQQ